MEILLTGGALGAVLGRYFKVLILVPAIGLAMAFLMVKCEIAELTIAETFCATALLIASVELGYVTGLLSADLAVVAQAFGKFWTRHRAAGQVRPR